ncbi:Monovalent cation/proton antiporter, MnhG/PhaG subunit OS=Tsukamurella paurometabola (strain ATCC 8368 / DSM / CCUG 35730 / CIP 100753 / JCM 10117 / KCTC 9821 / NBRC 16120 / NCIMB 702349 / NCTC 13040) OX=521096 GN=Tpau_3719 PE=4 SV=1 [Tsukamurella paurometabola]|uniref:Monovalent cation/proton antiporter, MnhG/PhaG subunit n=1 Tax=Tsukamurella paurometabola (strain ATCC 8368 / DSM 20162 / CCUG 35730 / CIP 100753 / JCM 10117 / KCTC 9821 / NBRC 16120 / NCIMB 702349 / NCTC 13040) TaxID=521096 RepID=D5UYJ4_TSUPD|nr:monovalent cation/H(+) antiporter subunit G [Tsukamurella paurometabola]ADG80297.1 monovalent cation/proton antiporter, MnhG/PhaG subunit [Tsukamurella paurometabola DSM 20162]SUP39178.1 Multiple resistance and pH homeostasis protein G [Tsukamurella paurometabola]
MVLDVIAAALMLTGAVFALTAAIGIVRFPDTLTRMHAATKPQTMGLLLLLGGSAVLLRHSVDVWMLILAGLFALLTAPVVAHRVGRVAYQEQRLRDKTIAVDDMETGARD